jgi:hypothetical protein
MAEKKTAYSVSAGKLEVSGRITLEMMLENQAGAV